MAEPNVESRRVDLAEVPIPTLLFGLLRERFSGTVTFEQPPPKHGLRTLLVSGGFPFHFDWEQETTRLGRLLATRGAASHVDIERWANEPGTDRLGHRAIANGVAPEAVYEALRQQCERRMLALFRLQAGQATLNPSAVEAGELWHARTLSVIAAGVADGLPNAELRRANPGGRCWAPRSSLERYRDAFEFPVELHGAIDWILGTDEFTVAELARESALPREQIKRLVYTLACCEMLRPTREIDAGQPTPVVMPPPVRDPLESHPPEAPLHDALQPAEIAELEALIVNAADPLDALGLEHETGTLRAIDAAAIDLLRRLDDRRVDPAGPTEVRVQAAQLRGEVADLRAAARARREALVELSANRFVKEGKFARALPLLREVAEHATRVEPLTRVLLAWAEFQVAGADREKAAGVLATVDDVLIACPNLAEAHYVRGMVLVLLDRSVVAQAAFDRVVELAPDNVDAQRQARVLRAGQPGTTVTRAVPTPSRSASFPVKKTVNSAFWSGPWPTIWIGTGLMLLLMAIAQVVLRLDVDY